MILENRRRWGILVRILVDYVHGSFFCSLRDQAKIGNVI